MLTINKLRPDELKHLLIYTTICPNCFDDIQPCHHNLEEYLIAYINETNLHDDPKGFLFRTIAEEPGN